MKEIHFYTNLCNEEQVSDWDLETMLTDYVGTKNAIDDPETNIVKTTQLSFLRNAWDFMEKGVKIYIHNGDESFQIFDHMKRKGIDAEELLLNNVFGKLC